MESFSKKKKANIVLWFENKFLTVYNFKDFCMQIWSQYACWQKIN